MKVLNVHKRMLQTPAEKVGELLDSLSAKDDKLWPHQCWPRMKFDGPLAVGASGGHGPIQYSVEEYVPGKRVVFRFHGPKGFDGFHGYDVSEVDSDNAELRQTLEMKLHGLARITWPLLYRPLHDALIQDSFGNAERALGLQVHVSKWSWVVKVLRLMVSRGKAPKQLLA